MHLQVRAATVEDGALLVRFLDATYGGGYLATFDRDGPLQPNDLWWVQSEKVVAVIEIDRQPAGMLITGRHRGQWLIEEVVVPAFGEMPVRSQEALVQRMGAHLIGAFQRGRQSSLLLRAAETNAFALILGRSLRLTFADALLVYRYRAAKRPPASPPDGYRIRRSGPADARVTARLVREVIPDRGRAGEIERVLGSREGRGYLAVREEFPVGFAAVEVRAGRGDWVVGVRENHRRRGVGRALASPVIGALLARQAVPFATAWAADPASGQFLRAIGFAVERTYIYLERPL
jgi:GNAT superfamily N-acetyltransferase